MELKNLHRDFSVCQVADDSLVKFNAEYCFFGKTDEERSLVCLTDDVPSNALRREDGWRGFRVQGTLDFSLVGILSGIAAVLAAGGIPLFVVSTYNTDYLFVKEAYVERAAALLRQAGYDITG